MPHPVCGTCGHEKTLYRDRSRVSGVKWHCTNCTMLRLRRHRRERPDLNRAKNARWQAENREKYLSHKAVENALVSGRIQRHPCETCGAVENVHAHHGDYGDPLKVVWLCTRHHRAEHRELAA